MRNFFKFQAIWKIAGIIAIVAVIGFSIAACGTSSGTSGSKQPQAQARQRLTEPVTEANFEYIQNQEGGITITGYKNENVNGIRDLVIPAQILGINVTEIAQQAFMLATYGSRYTTAHEIFESVTIPSTVKAIGARAFAERGIKKLILPEGLLYIRAGTFDSNELTSVTLPSTITEIGGQAFAKNQLTSIDFPAGVKVIGDYAFANNKLTKVIIPAGVTEIGNAAFANNQLTELTIPENVTSIGAGAFANNMISKLDFSGSSRLRSIGYLAFSKNQLKSVVLPASLTSIVEYIFSPDLYNVLPPENRDTGAIFYGNPLGYIKILSRNLNGSSRVIDYDAIVPAVEWEQPDASFVGKADAVKVGANIKTSNFDQGFRNFYTSQGNKAGIYMRRGTIWVTATQEEFDAFIAEKTK